MKALILPATILINVISFTAHADEPLGRFQLLSATVAIAPEKGPSVDRKMLLKIDTATGQVWFYVSAQSKDGTMVDKWIKIED